MSWTCVLVSPDGKWLIASARFLYIFFLCQQLKWHIGMLMDHQHWAPQPHLWCHKVSLIKVAAQRSSKCSTILHSYNVWLLLRGLCSLHLITWSLTLWVVYSQKLVQKIIMAAADTPSWTICEKHFSRLQCYRPELLSLDRPMNFGIFTRIGKTIKIA